MTTVSTNILVLSLITDICYFSLPSFNTDNIPGLSLYAYYLRKQTLDLTCSVKEPVEDQQKLLLMKIRYVELFIAKLRGIENPGKREHKEIGDTKRQYLRTLGKNIPGQVIDESEATGANQDQIVYSPYNEKT